MGVIYARYSSDNQREESIEGQLREMNEEIGITEKDLNHLDLRYIALRIVKGELRINYYFFADLKGNAKINYNCNEGILE